MTMLLPPRTIVIALAAAFLGGCATVMGDVKPFAPIEDTLSPQVVAPTPVGGSIYSGSNNLRLFEDNKARQVGDVLTIMLVERTAATTTAATNVGKDSSIAMSAPTIGGVGVTVGGYPILQAQVDGSRSFDGSSNSTQSNQLRGDVTVRVLKELGNGHLLVGGEKRMRLNQGDEVIQIQGIVRAADIGSDNRITSDRVADARIVYGGRGTLARSNAMGWLGRFFNSAAFPY